MHLISQLHMRLPHIISDENLEKKISIYTFIEGNTNCLENSGLEIILEISIHVPVTNERYIFRLDKYPRNHLYLDLKKERLDHITGYPQGIRLIQ